MEIAIFHSFKIICFTRKQFEGDYSSLRSINLFHEQLAIKACIKCAPSIPTNKKMIRVFSFALLCICLLVGCNSSILSLIQQILLPNCMSYHFHSHFPDASLSFYFSFVQSEKRAICSLSYDFFFSTILSLSSSTSSILSLLLCVLISSIGHDQSLPSSFTQKDLAPLQDCFHYYFSMWYALTEDKLLHSLYQQSFSLFLTQFPFCQASLSEVSQCSLYFRQILAFYRTFLSFSLSHLYRGSKVK